jgi:hypothetical protein
MLRLEQPTNLTLSIENAQCIPCLRRLPFNQSNGGNEKGAECCACVKAWSAASAEERRAPGATNESHTLN